MKISFKEFTRAYAEEYYFVLINQKKLIKKPEKRIKYATKSFIGCVIYAAFFVIVGIGLTIYQKEFLPFLFIPVLTLVATAYTYWRIRSNVIKLQKSDPSAFILNMTEKHIIYGRGKDNGVIMMWDEVKNVIYTDNSIIFLPNAIDIFPIVVPISAQKDVKVILKKKKIK